MMLSYAQHTYTPADAPAITGDLRGKELKFVRIVSKLADDSGGFTISAASRAIGDDYLDVLETAIHVRNLQIIKLSEDEKSGKFTKVGLAVVEQVRRTPPAQLGETEAKTVQNINVSGGIVQVGNHASIHQHLPSEKRDSLFQRVMGWLGKTAIGAFGAWIRKKLTGI